MNALLNRDFKLPADGWHQLAPMGRHPHPSGAIQVVDAKAVQAMCNRFAQEAKEANFPGLLVDFDHFSNDTSKPSEAAGWVTAVENRADGLWGQIRWSDVGEAAVTGGRYRLVSPVWNRSDCETISRGGAEVRPLRLDRVAVTNDPNIKGMAPLTNRAEHEQKHDMDKLAIMLGLSAGASDDAILAAVTQLQNRAQAAEAAVTPLKNRVSELEQANTGLLTAQVESDLARFENRLKPESKEAFKALLLQNRAVALKALEALPVAEGEGKQPMHNRAAAATPAGGASANVDKDAKRMAAVTEYKNRSGCSFEQAWACVQKAQPGLFD